MDVHLPNVSLRSENQLIYTEQNVNLLMTTNLYIVKQCAIFESATLNLAVN